MVSYLEEKGTRKDWMGFVIARCPRVLTLAMEERVRFYMDMGMSENDFGTMLLDYPRVLAGFSLEEMNCKDIRKVIALEPELLGCSIVHKFNINVKYFLSLGIRPHLLGDMIADFPMLLKYNLDIFWPKYQYLRRVMVRPLEDLIEFSRFHLSAWSYIRIHFYFKAFLGYWKLSSSSSFFGFLVFYITKIVFIPDIYFIRKMGHLRDMQCLLGFSSYSLEGRIMPRHRILVDNRVNFKLRYMLGGTDEDFDRRVKTAVEKRRCLKQELSKVTLRRL